MPVRMALTLTLVACFGCGARSGLRAPDVIDTISDVADASDQVDATEALDAFDAFDLTDVPVDRPPPICVDGGVQYIYLVSQENGLFSYYPPSGAFARIGTIACPVDPTVQPAPTPYSMGVDRSGTAYVVFNDGHLFRVSTATARCSSTAFVPDQIGFHTFGMGFVANTADPGETLYVTEANFMTTSQGLARLDTSSLALTFVGPFSRPLGRSELTGTGDGRLFAFSLEPTQGSTLAQIDPARANVLQLTRLAIGSSQDAFAFAFWGGDFYIFTAATNAPTTVSRYRPMDSSLVTVGSLSDTIVGAGVSTCAPQ